MKAIKQKLNFFICYNINPLATLSNIDTVDQFFRQLCCFRMDFMDICYSVTKGELNSNFEGGLVHITAN